MFDHKLLLSLFFYFTVNIIIVAVVIVIIIRGPDDAWCRESVLAHEHRSVKLSCLMIIFGPPCICVHRVCCQRLIVAVVVVVVGTVVSITFVAFIS